MAMGTTYQAVAYSIDILLENALSAQQQRANRRLRAVNAPAVGAVDRRARETK